MTPRDAILREVSEQASKYFGRSIPVDLLLKDTKEQDVVEFRRWAMAYLRWKHDFAYVRCARLLGRKDHTTARTGIMAARRKWPDAPFVRFSDMGFKLQQLGLAA